MPGAPLTEQASVPRRNYNLSAVAGTLMAPTIQQGAFDGPAKGMQAIGQGLAQVGQASGQIAAVIEDFRRRDNETLDIASGAEADAIRTDFMAKQMEARQTLPPDQWEKHFDDGFVELDGRLKKLQFSPAGQARFAADMTRWQADQKAQTFLSGRRQVMENRIATVEGEIDRRIVDGDTLGALALAHSSKNAGMITEAQLNEVTAAATKVTRERVQADMLATDPKGYLAEMSEGVKTGKSDVFDWMNDRKEFMRQEGIAKARISQLQSEALGELKSGVVNGSITDLDGIKKFNASKGDIFDEKDLPGFQTMLNKFGPLNSAVYGEFAARIDNYDIEKDPTGEKATRLEIEMAQRLPDKAASDLASRLNDRKKMPKAEAAFVTSFLNEIGTLGDAGLLNDGKTGKKGSKITNPAVHAENWEKIETAKEYMRQWFKTNPKASPKQARDEFTSYLGQEVSDAAASRFKIQTEAQSTIKWGINAFGVPTMTTAEERLDLTLVDAVKGMEGFYETAYSDYKQHSVGYGTRAKSPSERITKEEADKRLRKELAMHVGRIDDAAKKGGYKLTAGQRNALTSFDFNTGKGAYLLETSGGDLQEVARRMGLYTKVTEKGKKVDLPGLVARRKKELEIFNS